MLDIMNDNNIINLNIDILNKKNKKKKKQNKQKNNK